jgi:hypothetical protein
VQELSCVAAFSHDFRRTPHRRLSIRYRTNAAFSFPASATCNFNAATRSGQLLVADANHRFRTIDLKTGVVRPPTFQPQVLVELTECLARRQH